LGISHQHASPDKRKSNSALALLAGTTAALGTVVLKGVLAWAAKYQISGTKNQSLTGHPGDFRFQGREKIKLASQNSQW
jgi:hypothetical protein